MTRRFIACLSTRNPQIAAELLVPPTTPGEAVAWWVWLALFFLAPPS